MPEEEVKAQQTIESSQQKPVDRTEKYIQAINELKANTVTKEAYDELEAENKKLFDQVINGTVVKAEVVEKVDLDALRKDLFQKDNNNLEYCKKALKLRQAIIDSGGVDPFVPTGKNIQPTQEDYDAAERVATVLQECIDNAQGDSAIFTNELQRRTVDVNPSIYRR